MSPRYYPWVVVIVGIVMALLSLTLPEPKGMVWPEFHITFAVNCLQTALFVGAGWMFVLGVRNFRYRLRVAYGLLAFGLVLYGIGQIQLPVFQLLNLYKTPWVQYGGIQVPYLVGGMLVVAGVQQFAAILGVRGFSVGWGKTIGVIMAVGALGILIQPTAKALILNPGGVSSWPTRLIVAIGIAEFIVATIVFFLIRGKIGASYVNAMAWSFIAMAGMVIAASQVFVLQIVGFGWWFESGPFAVVYLLAGVLLVRAAYAFNLIRSS